MISVVSLPGKGSLQVCWPQGSCQEDGRDCAWQADHLCRCACPGVEGGLPVPAVTRTSQLQLACISLGVQLRMQCAMQSCSPYAFESAQPCPLGMPSLSGLFSAGLTVVVGFLLQVHTRTYKLRDKYSGVPLVWWMLVNVAVSSAATSLHLDLSPCSKHCYIVKWLASSILQ
jgi:hypothetical protein